MKILTKEAAMQQELAQQYLHGRLSDEQNEKFEQLLMDNPEIIEQMHIDKILQTHVKPLPVKHPSVREAWHRVMGKPLYYAFTFALAFILGIFVNPSITSDDPAGLQGNIEIAYVSSLRGQTSSPDTIISLNDQIDTLLLVLQPNSQQQQNYHVTVSDAHNQFILINNAIYTSNDYGEIKLAMGKSHLQPGLMKIDFAPVDHPSKQESMLVELIK